LKKHNTVDFLFSLLERVLNSTSPNKKDLSLQLSLCLTFFHGSSPLSHPFVSAVVPVFIDSFWSTFDADPDFGGEAHRKEYLHLVDAFSLLAQNAANHKYLAPAQEEKKKKKCRKRKEDRKEDKEEEGEKEESEGEKDKKKEKEKREKEQEQEEEKKEEERERIQRNTVPPNLTSAYSILPILAEFLSPHLSLFDFPLHSIETLNFLHSPRFWQFGSDSGITVKQFVSTSALFRPGGARDANGAAAIVEQRTKAGLLSEK
jgi:hypothetical protein